MKSVFVYPTGGKSADSLINPYIRNMKDAFDARFKVIKPSYRNKYPRMMFFLLSSFKADVYVINWIEDNGVGKWNFIGAILSMLGLFVLVIRKAKIVWVFHNIEPHNGFNFWGRVFYRFLYKHSSIIVSHSKEAKEYAQRFAKCPVYFKNHPMKRVDYGTWEGDVKDCDFFYWSGIYDYKGVVEFLANPLCKASGKKIYILGKAANESIKKNIEANLGDNILFEDRVPSFSEVAAHCRKARYVIFPYIGESISSSGVLMDTLLMGGIPLGPNRGAFADLASQGCCLTYNNIDEVFSLPTDGSIKLDADRISRFIDNNSWPSFSEWLYTIIDRE